MILEIRGWSEVELSVLGSAVVVPGAGYAVDDGDVKGEVEGRDGIGGEVLVCEFPLLGRMREEDGEGRASRVGGEVVGQMD